MSFNGNANQRMGKMIKNIGALVLILVMTANTGLAQEKRLISVGEEISASLQSESSNDYEADLQSNYYVFGKVNQRSVDVVVTIFNPDGKEVTQFDGPARGNETFQFNTKDEGIYRIEVTPFENEEGEYSITLNVAEPIAEDPAGKVNQMMTEYSGNVPGAAAMVIKDGEVVFQNSYGMANLAYDVKMKPETIHNIGSTSKHFLTFGLLLLKEEGALSLDDDIRKYIPELPEFEHTVTLRNLVNHTSGYREFLNTLVMTGRSPSMELDQEKVIEMIRRQPELQNEPGAEFNYNNTGYVLMTEVIERVTETPFQDWMKEHVFEPIGMENTLVRVSPKQVVENRSMGYEPGEDGGFKEVTDLGGAMGPGGIHTTMGDLEKWIGNLLEPKVGTKEMIKEMTTPFVLNNGSSTGYGIGLFSQEFKGLEYFHHGGADLAHRSMLMVFPEVNGAIVTQSNYAAFRGDIPQKIAEYFFEEHMSEDEPKEEIIESEEAEEFIYDAADFEPLTGRYELTIMPGFILTFSREGNRIYTQATGQPEIDITATTDSTFDLKGVNAAVTFHRNEDGSADSLTLHQNGNHIAKKIKFDPNFEELEEYTGRYFSDEIETLYTIVLEDSSLVLQNYQLEEDIKLTPGNIDSFGGGFPIAEISFERNENGTIIGFNASNGRTRGVYFRKWDE